MLSMFTQGSQTDLYIKSVFEKTLNFKILKKSLSRFLNMRDLEKFGIYLAPDKCPMEAE